jgi:hypothetical protein
LRDDLEASLVPLNRAATRRVLGRLLREVHREGGDRSAGGAQPDRAALDGELDALLGVEPGTEPPPPPPDPEPDPEPAPARADGADDGEQRAPKRPMERARREPESPAPRLSTEGLDEFERASEQGGRGGIWLGVGLVVLAAVLLAAYLLLGREQSRAMLGMEPQPRGGAGEAAASASQPPAQPTEPATPQLASHGQLRVTSAPERAQVLMFVGAGPARAEQLPMGVAHEFVALADGHAPVRAVVPPDAEWEPASEGGAPRYELAMQLPALEPDDKRRAAREGDLGATKLPAQPGTPSGGLGTVRVLTTPPGARVYQLVGFTPDVRIDNLPLDQPVELALYLGGHALERITVSREDYEQRGGQMLATLDVKLRHL